MKFRSKPIPIIASFTCGAEDFFFTPEPILFQYHFREQIESHKSDFGRKI